MTEYTKEERIILIGYALGTIAREANQKGDVEVSTETIERVLELFGVTELTAEEDLLLEFTESMNFKVNLEQNANREERRWKLRTNKKVYKLQ